MNAVCVNWINKIKDYKTTFCIINNKSKKEIFYQCEIAEMFCKKNFQFWINIEYKLKKLYKKIPLEVFLKCA